MEKKIIKTDKNLTYPLATTEKTEIVYFNRI